MCDSPQLKDTLSIEPTLESGINNQESPINNFDQNEENPPENNFVETEKQEELNIKPSDSSSPQVSDGKLGSKATTKTSLLSSSLRTTRSKDNPEFVAKQKSFMAKVQAATSGTEPLSPASDRPDTPGKRKRESTGVITQCGKKKKFSKADNGSQASIKEWQNDNCCWECHREGQFICCEMCPRVFHLRCAGLEKEPDEDWACSECHAVMQAENVDNRSRAMQLISVDQLCILLKYALNRLKAMPVMEPFSKPVDVSEFPTYWDIVVHPVDFCSLEKNIKKKFYGSTEAFLSDARWIVHNSVIFNGANSKVTSLAKTLIKILKQELSEIETCPDCYENAHKKPDRWFCEACRLAHPLVWARLKGFPFWPAKAVKWKDTNVDVRFFGRHDRSWVPLKECFLFSEQMPTPLKSRNKTLETCLVEVSDHIKKLRERFGKFKYAPHRLPFNPYDNDQIRVLLPLYKGPAILRIKSQPFSTRPPGYSGTDDETSSIASTDSGNSSYSRWRKRSLKDRSALNTPDTETETDNISMEGDMLQHCKMEDTMDTKEDMEDEEGMEVNYTVSIAEENEPPDKTDGLKEENETFNEEDDKDRDVNNTEIDKDKEINNEEEEQIDNEDEGKEETYNEEENKEEMDEVDGKGEYENEDKREYENEENKEYNEEDKETELDDEDEDHGRNLLIDESVVEEEEEENTETKSCNSEDGQQSISNPSDENSSNKSQFVPDNDISTKDNESSNRIVINKKLSLSLSKDEVLDDKENSLLRSLKEDSDGTTTLKINKSISMKVIKLTSVKLPKDQKAPPSGALTFNSAVKRALKEKSIKDNVKSPQNEEEPEVKEPAHVEATTDQIDAEETKEEENDTGKGEENLDCEEKYSKNVSDNENDLIKDTDENDHIKDTDPVIDENVRNFERINELLRGEQQEEDRLSEMEEEQANMEKEEEKEDEEEKDDDDDEEMEIDKDKSTEMVLSKLNEMLDESLEVGKKIIEKESKDTPESKNNNTEDKEMEKKDKQEDMMDDNYFQGFLDEINLRKKLEAYQELLKNVRFGKMSSGDLNDEEMGSENEEDEEDAPKSNESNLNEQLLTNSSLTIGKVSLPKSIKIQKMADRERKNSLEDEDEFNGGKFSLPSVNIKSVLASMKGDNRKKEFEDGNGDEEEHEDEEEEDEDIGLKEDVSKMEANSSIIDFQNYANKIFHNITISSKSLTAEKESTNSQKSSKSNSQPMKNSEENKAVSHVPNETKERRSSKEAEERVEKPERSSKNTESENEKEKEDSLMEAVKLVKKIGNIAIKRVDSQTLEHTSGSDRVTISVANTTSDSSSNKTVQSSSKGSKNYSSKDKKSDNPLAGFGTSVSVTKASDKEREKEKDKEKIKMPSGVDTTRLSPSISIIPVASSSSSEKPRDKIFSTLCRSTTPQSSSITTPTTTMTTVCSSSASPSVSLGGSTTPSSSISASPNIPPPPLLSHSLPSPTGTNVRGMFGPPISGIGMPGGPRTPITSPGLRMMGNSPGMMMGGRFPGPPLGRHLPPEAGPLSNELHKHAHKLAEMMRASLEEVLGGLVGLGTPEARLGALQLELERCNWRHQQELIEVRHNADVMLVEMRANLEAEKQRAVEEARRQMEQKLVEMRRQMEMQMAEKISEVRRQGDIEKQRAIEETKKKQWCANCGKEALFFCCWNTSYCDYPCQQAHWPQHMSVCGQNSDTGGGGGGQSNTDGGVESVNGDASTHSSRGPTPVQGHHVSQMKNYIEEEDISYEETKLRRNRMDGRSERLASIPGLLQTVKKLPRKFKKKRHIKSKSLNHNRENYSDSDTVEPIVEAASNVAVNSLLMNWFTDQEIKPSEENVDQLRTNQIVQRKKRRRNKFDEETSLSSKKKRKSTPCVRKRVDLILSPSQVTAEMLSKVASKPKEKIHDQGIGTSCHQCRQKTSDTKTICRSGKCVGLRGFFCGPCLKTRYGEDARKAILNPSWSCPVCRGICNCSVCRKTIASLGNKNAKNKIGTDLVDPDISGLSEGGVKEDN